MEAWERLGFDSADDYVRDRFYDENDEDVRREPVCGDCDEWTRCSIQGHEDIGWCSKWDDFMSADDESCEED